MQVEFMPIAHRTEEHCFPLESFGQCKYKGSCPIYTNRIIKFTWLLRHLENRETLVYQFEPSVETDP